MSHFDNTYYVQYANEMDTEQYLDLDNRKSYGGLYYRSPSGSTVYSKYIQRRNKQELLHHKWIARIHKDSDFQKNIQRNCNMKVQLYNNFVNYTYKYRGNKEILGVSTFKFRIILVYVNLLRKWYISSAYSFLPETINLKNKLRSGTYDPVSKEILNLVSKVKLHINTFMMRLTSIHQFIQDIRNNYKDMQFHLNATLTKMKMIFSENAWPNNLPKLSFKDMIIVQLILNENIEVCNIYYEYKQIHVSVDMKEACLNKLLFKLDYFRTFPLVEAFERFMEEDNCTDQEISD